MNAYIFRIEFVGYGDTPDGAWDDVCESLWTGGWLDMPEYERAPELDLEDDDDEEQDQNINDGKNQDNADQ
jgi:hypothetical protein